MSSYNVKLRRGGIDYDTQIKGRTQAKLAFLKRLIAVKDIFKPNCLVQSTVKK